MRCAAFGLTLLCAAAAAAAPPAPGDVTAAKAADKPGPGFIEMFVAGVVPTPDGNTLVLVNPDEQVLLPLGIGLTEALSIHGRLEKRAFERPMTHDLLDHIVKELGGQIVRVQIDDVRDDVFVGTVFIKTAGKVIQFDARPSDAVALALGSRVPIYVARPVVDRAAIHPGDLDTPPPAASSTPPAPQKGVLAL
jgi:bifunctional DNase/RNase